MTTLTNSRYVTREEMAEVLKQISRLVPSSAGPGPRESLDAFIRLAKQARELMSRYTVDPTHEPTQ